MVTPRTEFRLARRDLDALARIVAAIRPYHWCLVTRAVVVRWLIRLHDPANNPDTPITRDDVRCFPHVFRVVAPGLGAPVGGPTGTGLRPESDESSTSTTPPAVDTELTFDGDRS